MLSKISVGLALLVSTTFCYAANQPGGEIDPKAWYALWNNGQNFLSVDTITNASDNSTHYLIGRFAPGAEDVESTKDMGQRFQFPDGIGGPVRAQVHAEHSIGVTGDSLGHWSSFATDNSSFATVQWIVENESIAIVRNNHDYVSVGGLVTPEITGWYYAQIQPVIE